MLSPEHRAVLLLLGLGVAGHVVRMVASDARRPPGAVRLPGRRRSAGGARTTRQSGAPCPPGSAGRAHRRGPGLGPGTPAAPGCGSGTGAAHRRSAEPRGPVRGHCGAPAGAKGSDRRSCKRMAPNLAFSARPRTPSLATPVTHRRPGRRPLPSRSRTEVINRGSLADLERISGIGRRRAARIVAFRDSAGPFRNAARTSPACSASALRSLRLSGRLPGSNDSDSGPWFRQRNPTALQSLSLSVRYGGHGISGGRRQPDWRPPSAGRSADSRPAHGGGRRSQVGSPAPELRGGQVGARPRNRDHQAAGPALPDAGGGSLQVRGRSQAPSS